MVSQVQLPTLPALVVGIGNHTRRVPIVNSFEYKAYQWLKSVEKSRPVIYSDTDGEWNSDL